MKLSRLMVGLTVVLAGSLAANAAVIGVWTTAAVGANNITQWTLTLTSDAGDITSLDLKLTPPAGASFNQPASWIVASTPWQDSASDAGYTMAVPPSSRAEGTFFLFDGAAVTAPGALVADTTSLLQAPFTSFTGFAGPQAVVQIGMADTVTDAPVLGSQDPAHPDWGIAVVGGAKELIIPEPATLALLALGSVALIRRRRR